MMTIEEFCDLHGACDEGREWAISECKTMQDVWDKAKPDWLVWVATRGGVLDDRTLRLFACWSIRQVWHLITDERSRNAVIVAEKHADGLATNDELAAARAAAAAAAADAAYAAAWDVAWAASAAAYAASAAASAAAYAARSAAWAVAYAACDVASDAASDAAWDVAGAARSAAWAVAGDAASDALAEWLRANAKPCFEKGGKG